METSSGLSVQPCTKGKTKERRRYDAAFLVTPFIPLPIGATVAQIESQSAFLAKNRFCIDG